MKTKTQPYTKLSKRARREKGAEQGLSPETALEVVKPKPGPLSLESVRSEMLRQAGFSLDLIKKSVDTLERNLSSEEPFAQLTPAKMLLQLANAFPSKTAQAPQKIEVVVSMKPFAQVIDSTAREIPALPEARK